MVPVLEWRLENGVLGYRWQNVVHGFAMPVRVSLEPGASRWIRPTERWQALEAGDGGATFEVDPGFFVETREVE
jgi:hypothetical protein